MNYPELRALKTKGYFGVEDLRDLLKITQESARVVCSRYTKTGVFVRLKNNLYVLQEKWEGFGRADFFKTANVLQVPSYISFMTALSFHEVTTQVQQTYFESVSLKRSMKANIDGSAFMYYKLKKEYYFDFFRKDGFFIATREKALTDSLYLHSFGKYSFDAHSIDFRSFDTKKLKDILKKFPLKTRAVADKLCKI